jgi:hypothetical protein
VIAMLVAEDESQSVLTATENGYGKRTSIVEYTRHGRGTKGMIAIQQSERNGKVVAATLVRAEDEIMLITDKGVLVRTRVSEIRELGRATQGVTLIALDNGTKLSGLQRIAENDTPAVGGDNPEGAEGAEVDAVLDELVAQPPPLHRRDGDVGTACFPAGHGLAHLVRPRGKHQAPAPTLFFCKFFFEVFRRILEETRKPENKKT